jgi:hypothetical protein
MASSAYLCRYMSVFGTLVDMSKPLADEPASDPPSEPKLRAVADVPVSLVLLTVSLTRDEAAGLASATVVVTSAKRVRATELALAKIKSELKARGWRSD